VAASTLLLLQVDVLCSVMHLAVDEHTMLAASGRALHSKQPKSKQVADAQVAGCARPPSNQLDGSTIVGVFLRQA
jgi:hypothetical protein